MFSIIKTKNGQYKKCPASSIEPTENTETCAELSDATWHYGDTTFARTKNGNRVAVEPIFFHGKLNLQSPTVFIFFCIVY